MKRSLVAVGSLGELSRERAQHQRAGGSEDGFWMELHTHQRQAAVTGRHDNARAGGVILRRDGEGDEGLRKIGGAKGVIAGHNKPSIRTALAGSSKSGLTQAGLGEVDSNRATMHRTNAADTAATGLHHRLETQANPERWDALSKGGFQHLHETAGL